MGSLQKAHPPTVIEPRRKSQNLRFFFCYGAAIAGRTGPLFYLGAYTEKV